MFLVAYAEQQLHTVCLLHLSVILNTREMIVDCLKIDIWEPKCKCFQFPQNLTVGSFAFELYPTKHNLYKNYLMCRVFW